MDGRAAQALKNQRCRHSTHANANIASWKPSAYSSEACGGASIVAGVEGSHLVHGLMLMPRKATLMVVQPPERAVSVLKMITDRQGQRYAFVVATGDGVRFSAEWSEIVRTVDLILKEA